MEDGEYSKAEVGKMIAVLFLVMPRVVTIGSAILLGASDWSTEFMLSSVLHLGQ